MLNKELSVKVVIGGYQDVAESKDPKVCAQVLAILAEHGVTNPETPEQQLVRELQQKAADADMRTYEQKSRADNLQTSVESLTKKVDELRDKIDAAKAAPIPAPTGAPLF